MSDYKYTAKYYDLFFAPFVAPLRRKVVEIIGKDSDLKVIDLCCGTGNQLKYLYKNGIKDVVGVDRSSHMIAKARRYPFQSLLADASKTAFKGQSFDIALIEFALHESDPGTARKIVNEAKRLLKDGGRIIVVDYMNESEMNFLTKRAVNFVEFMAGADHYANYKSYQRNGGISHLAKSLHLLDQRQFRWRGIAVSIYEGSDKH